MLCLLLFLSSALGADISQELTWNVLYQGKVIGSRTLTVRYVEEGESVRRIITGETSIDGNVAGFPVTWQQRLTANAIGRSPAAFHSVVSENGTAREVQGRLAHGEWLVSLVENGRARSWELDLAAIDLSTADLFDPQSAYALDKYSSVKMLSAETGDVWEQDVERLGQTTVTIRGQKIPVDGVAVEPPQGRAEFWYGSDGVLVRSEYRLLGRKVEAILRDPPPPGVDDVPVPGSGISDIDEIEL